MSDTIETKEIMKTYDIPDVEIFRSGEWTDSAGRRTEYTAEDIAEMAAASAALEGRLEAPVKLGHDPEQPLLRSDGLPAAGWLRNVRAAGGRLFADLAGVPGKLYELIRAGAYKKRSLEVLHNYRDEATGRVYRHVAAGLALLGANLPAIGSLADIRALYAGAAGGSATYFYEAATGGEEAGEGVPYAAVGEDADAQQAGAAERVEGLLEVIALLEARVAELESLIADETAPDDDVEALDEIEGTPLTDDESGEATEEIITEETNEEADMDNGTVFDEAAERLSAALEELEELRRRESERRWRDRESFMAAHARKVPPAHREVVSEVLALLDGDFSVSEYSAAGGGVAAGFRLFIASIADHPAMSEYGRERGELYGYAAADEDEDTVDARIRRYCEEHGLNPDNATDYASAALAILAYEKPPEQGAVDEDEGDFDELRESNENFAKLLAHEAGTGYTVNMTSNNKSSGCAACRGAADVSAHGWWKDIERGVKGERKEIEREVKETKNELKNKIKDLPYDAIEGLAGKLQGIDNDYRRCRLNANEKNYPPRWEGIRTGDFCNDMAVESARNLIRTTRLVLDLFFDVGSGANKTVSTLLGYTEYDQIRKGLYNGINMFAHSNLIKDGMRILRYFDFLNKPI